MVERLAQGERVASVAVVTLTHNASKSHRDALVIATLQPTLGRAIW